MARAPIPGRVKTRLEPAFTRAECAAIQAHLVRRTARWAVEHAAPGAAFVAFDAPESRAAVERLVPPGCQLLEQRGDHLGERLQHAVLQIADRHPGPLIVVGTDTRLTPEHALEAGESIRRGADVVLGPSLDGGYYLMALARPGPEPFAISPAAWGGPDVLEASRRAAEEAGKTTVLLERIERDLDTPEDAEALASQEDPPLAAILERGLRDPLVTIVVPTRDEATELPALLDHIAGLDGRFETIVADGGSRDGTATTARAHPHAPRVIEEPGGRAAQLNVGARAARGDPIVFLHADTRLPPDAYEQLRRTHADGGNFDLRFGGRDGFSRVLGAWYRVQRRRFGVYYGDSAIWLRRSTFEALGGFRNLPIMDDYDLARRLERRFRTACLPGPAITSARRWRALGVPRTVLSWVAIRWLYLAGVPPERLALLYRRAR